MTQTPVHIVRDFIGEFDEAAIERIVKAPSNQLEVLDWRLREHYNGWLSEQEPADDETHYLFSETGTLEAFRTPQRRISEINAAILYFQRLAVADPLANALAWGPVWTEKSREALAKSLKILLYYRELIEERSLLLVPIPFFLKTDAAEIELKPKLDALRVAYDAGEFDCVRRNSFRYRKTSRGTIDTGPTVTSRPPFVWSYATGATQAHLAYRIGSIPLSSNRYFQDAIEKVFEIELSKVAIETEASVAKAAISYTVPGVKDIDLSEIIRVRKGSDAFRQFRAKYGQVIKTAVKDARGNNKRFAKLFKEAVDAEILPAVKAIENSIKKPSKFHDLFMPMAMSVGGAFLGHTVGQGDLMAVYIGGALAPAPWIARVVHSRFSESTKDDHAVATLYAHLIQNTS